VSANVMPHETIVDLLTNHFELTGTRESCGQGLCGCCTVHVDGTPVSGCLSLAAFLDGTEVATIEGLADGDTLDPVQQAFIDASAFQCGFCTSGFIMMTKKLLEQYPNPTDDQIRHYLTGNLCRCSAYPEIMEAVKLAASRAQA
jgi:carbon-monoxide dehydrogenase small subunit